MHVRSIAALRGAAYYCRMLQSFNAITHSELATCCGYRSMIRKSVISLSHRRLFKFLKRAHAKGSTGVQGMRALRKLLHDLFATTPVLMLKLEVAQSQM